MDVKHHVYLLTGVVQSRSREYSEYVRKMTDIRKQKAEKASELPIKHSLFVGIMQIGQ